MRSQRKPFHYFNNELVKSLHQSSIRNIFRLANDSLTRSDKVADLSLGNPYGLPPKSFYVALKDVLASKNDHYYTDNAGIIEVRNEIANSLIKRGLMPSGLTGKEIIISSGASGGINCVLRSIINKGDEVIIIAPYFPDFPFYVKNHGGVLKIVHLSPPKFNLDLEQIEKTINNKTKAIILNTPNNPTGNVYSTSEIQQLHSLLKKIHKKYGHPIFLISDEPYREIIFLKKNSADYISPATKYGYSFMIYSFSKSLCIPGERIGYIAIHPKMENKELMSEVLTVTQRKLGFTNAPALMQKTIKSLLFLKPNISVYLKKRDIICNGLKDAGYEFIIPQGTYYVWVKCPVKDLEFFKLTKRFNIFVVPGIAFGLNGYFRLAYSRKTTILYLAINKLRLIKQQISK